MNEKKLARLSVAGIFVCFILLYLVTYNLSSLHVNIGEIDKSFAGKVVNITGFVKSIRENDGNIFMNLQDATGEIKIVLWEDTIRLLETKNIDANAIKIGESINVVGDVQIYMGELEVIPMRGNVRLIENS